MRPLWQAAALVTLMAATSIAVAQQVSPAPITEPVWIAEPPRAQFRYPFSTREYRARVPLQCRVAGDTLVECQAAEPTPENFLGAAIEAATRARIAAQDGDGASTDGRQVAVTIRFPGMPIPVAVDPPPAPPPPSIVTNMTWLERPTARHFAQYYPREALAQGVHGRATLECLVGADGRLACMVLSEDPPGARFGEAALRVSRHFRMASETRDGRPTEGGRVHIPIRFSMQ